LDLAIIFLCFGLGFGVLLSITASAEPELAVV
jgi:hypothetical protein